MPRPPTGRICIGTTARLAAFSSSSPPRSLLHVRLPEAEPASLLDTLLVLAVGLNVAAALFGNVLVDIWSARLLLPTLVFGAILLGRRGPRRPPVLSIYAAALCVSVGVSARNYSHASTGDRGHRYSAPSLPRMTSASGAGREFP